VVGCNAVAHETVRRPEAVVHVHDELAAAVGGDARKQARRHVKGGRAAAEDGELVHRGARWGTKCVLSKLAAYAMPWQKAVLRFEGSVFA
jgi:hypothetical protein